MNTEREVEKMPEKELKRVILRKLTENKENIQHYYIKGTSTIHCMNNEHFVNEVDVFFFNAVGLRRLMGKALALHV